MTYQRKTKDIWILQSNYNGKWSTETWEETKETIRKRLQEYKKNMSYSLRIIKKRVPITEFQKKNFRIY